MKGFTLVETLVAVSILTLSVVGPMSVASAAIVATHIASHQLTASYLAQEGVEYVRAARDNEYLALHPGSDTRSAWRNFLTSIAHCNATTDSARACTLDTGSAVPLKQCSVGSCAPMNLTLLAGGNHGYTQQSGTATPFTRTVQVIDMSPTDARIVSTVSWNSRGTPYSVTIVNNLTPWQ